MSYEQQVIDLLKDIDSETSEADAGYVIGVKHAAMKARGADIRIADLEAKVERLHTLLADIDKWGLGYKHDPDTDSERDALANRIRAELEVHDEL